MSGLVPFAVLVSTVRALRGATVVGNNVLEAPLDPVDELFSNAGHGPVIAVYVGNEEQKTEAHLLLEGERKLQIAFQIYLPESLTLDVNGRTVALDTRGLGVEVAFAAIWRQCMRALQSERQDSPWPGLWGRFVTRIHEVNSEPYLFEIPGKTRVAAREVIIVADTADEPDYGAEPYPVWRELAEALAADPDYGQDIADLLLAEITAGDERPGWTIVASSQGVSRASAHALGIGPYDQTEDGEPPVLESDTADQTNFDGRPRLSTTDALEAPATFLPPDPSPP